MQLKWTMEWNSKLRGDMDYVEVKPCYRETRNFQPYLSDSK